MGVERNSSTRVIWSSITKSAAAATASNCDHHYGIADTVVLAAALRGHQTAVSTGLRCSQQVYVHFGILASERLCAWQQSQETCTLSS
jgi:hypothetical protein